MAPGSAIDLVAVAASAAMVFLHKPRLMPVIALVASGIALLLDFGLLHLSIANLPLRPILAAALLAAAVFVHWKTSAKLVITAATIAATIGLLQILSALHLV